MKSIFPRPLRSLASALFVFCPFGILEANPHDHALDDQFLAQAAALLPEEAIAAVPLPPADAVVEISERYFKGTWGSVISWPHTPMSAANLPDGRVITLSSSTRNRWADDEFSFAAVFDPDTEVLTEINHPSHNMFCAGPAMLADGRALFAGGRNNASDRASYFDWETDAWVRVEDMSDTRWYSSGTALPNGSMISASAGKGTGGDTVERFDPGHGWTILSNIDWSGLEEDFASNYLAPNGKVAYIGPNQKMHWIETDGSGSLTPTNVDPGLQREELSGGNAIYAPGKIIVAGGMINQSSPRDIRTESFSVDINSEIPVVTPIAPLKYPRRFHNTLMLPTGDVIVLGGNSNGIKFNDTESVYYPECWNPATNTWVELAPAATPRNYHSTALLLHDGRIFSAGGGGNGNSPANHLNAEIFTPPYLYDLDGTLATRPLITSAPEQVSVGDTIRVNTDSSIERFTMCRMSATTHHYSSDIRFSEVSFTDLGNNQYDLALESNENVLVPGYWMLFALNANGTPSVSAIVHVGLAPPRIAQTADQQNTIGDPINLQIEVTSQDDDYTLTASGLPPGLTMTSTGLITGSPTQNGTFTVNLTATDPVTGSSTQSLTWTISVPITLDPLPNPPIQNGTSSTYQINAVGENLTFRWNFGDGSPLVNTTSPSASHTFDSPGQYLITATATNGVGESRQVSFRQVIHSTTTSLSPTASSSLIYHTVSNGNDLIWNANPDNDSVSVFHANSGQKLAEIPVGKHPQTLALAPDDRIWVANGEDSTLSIINPLSFTVVSTITLPRGSAPYGLTFSPDGSFGAVVLEGSGLLLKLDSSTGAIIDQTAIADNCRHLSITADSSRILVSRFISAPVPDEHTTAPNPGTTNGGDILTFDASNLDSTTKVVLRHSTLNDNASESRGLPNYLTAPVISPDGLTAWVASKQDNIARGTARDGLPLTHENTVRAISSRIDLDSLTESYPSRVSHDDSSIANAAAFDPTGGLLYVSLETSREVGVIDPYSSTELARLNVGLAPRALALSPDGSTLYVHNFMDRTISVLDVSSLRNLSNFNTQTLGTWDTVADETFSNQVLLGKQLFYDARDGRLALENYMSCASCHNDAGHDGRVWDFTGFGEGLRNTIDLRGRGGPEHGALHWTANFDEFQDFEGQIRNFAGGTGLLTNGNPHPTLGTPNSGQSEDLDALAAYMESLTEQPQSPYREQDGNFTADALAGRELFASKNCTDCHNGPALTDSGLAFHDIGTLTTASGQRLGGALSGLDTPSLLASWAGAPYLHDGSAHTLGEAIDAHNTTNVTNAERAQLVAYLQQLESGPLRLAEIVSEVIAASAPFELQLTAAGGQAPYSYSASGLPFGLSVNPSTGLITGTVPASQSGNHPVIVTVTDGVNDSQTISLTLTVTDQIVSEINFNTSAQGFTYSDDTFRNTNQPTYASGSRLTNGGPDNSSALCVTVGGVDDDDILNMSGGWSYAFEVSGESSVTIQFQYKLDFPTNYDAGEYGQALASFNGSLLGTGPANSLAQIDETGGIGSTGWQTANFDLGTLQAGTHTLTLGAFNNLKTTAAEFTTVCFDNLVITETVFSLNTAPSLGTLGDRENFFGTNIDDDLSAAAFDLDQDPLIWSATGLPTGINIEPTSGTLFGNPSANGTFNPTITITDPEGLNASQTFEWLISPEVIIPEPTLAFGGTAAAVPGRIEAENYDTGGAGISYSDTDPENFGANFGPNFRDEGVDLEDSFDTGNTPAIGWIEDGEWTQYSVSLTAGTYDLVARAASELTIPGSIRVLLDDSFVGEIDISSTGGWYSWEDFTLSSLTIPNGEALLRLEFQGASFNLNWIEIRDPSDDPPTPEDNQTPFGGSAASIPGRIEAENFDEGGLGVAYLDSEEENFGLTYTDLNYRSSGVDIESSFDTNATPSLGWTDPGEWMEYTVNVTPGTYDLKTRVASGFSLPGDLEVELNGRPLGTFNVNGTGDWYNWETLTIPQVAITETGTHILRLRFEGAAGFNLNWVEFGDEDLPPIPTGQSPFGGTAHAMPGRVQAEDYDLGGEGVAYSDADTENLGGSYRGDAVDIEPAGDTDGGFAVGWFDDSQWMEYTLAASPGVYRLDLRVASNESIVGDVRITLDGEVLGTIDVQSTGGWDSWVTLSLPDIAIATSGEQALRLEMVGDAVNINWFEFTQTAAASNLTFTTIEQVGQQAAATEDSDGDNTSNLAEFAFGSNAGSANSRPVMPVGFDHEGNCCQTVPVAVGGTFGRNTYHAAGLTYTFQGSTDLTNWDQEITFIGNPSDIPNPPSGYHYITFRLTETDNEHGFLRVMVTEQQYQ